jgi:hypothetical protein
MRLVYGQIRSDADTQKIPILFDFSRILGHYKLALVVENHPSLRSTKGTHLVKADGSLLRLTVKGVYIL